MMNTKIEDVQTKWPMVREGLLRVVVEQDDMRFTITRVESDDSLFYAYTSASHFLLLKPGTEVILECCESDAEKRVMKALSQAGISFEELYPIADGWQIEVSARKATVKRKLEEAGFQWLRGEQGELDGAAYTTVAFLPPYAPARSALEIFVEREFDRTDVAVPWSERCAELTDALLCIGDPDRARIWLKAYGKDAGAIYAEQRPHESLQDCLNRMVMAVVLGSRTPPSWVDIALDLQNQLREAQAQVVALTDKVRKLRVAEPV